jgi:TonB family protein
MMAIASLSNLFAVSVQIACVALLAGALIWGLRITSAGLSYALWRGVLVVCLALPFIQTPHGGITVVPAAMLPADTAAALAPGTVNGAPPRTPVDWSWWIGLTLLAGVIARLTWLGIGIYRLRALRRCGERACDSRTADLQAMLGTRAEIRYAFEVRQPVTFGLRRPVVLLPASLRALPAIRDAVLTHELVHVRRRDWASVLAEETVRAVLWFHPVLWWVISRVQLAREEVVDATAVALTGRRQEYLRALLTFADDVPLAPAPAFARRRHLFRRILLLSTEEVMSARRIIASAVAVGIVVVMGGWSATGAFPMQGEPSSIVQPQPGPVEARAAVATSGDMLPRRIHSEPPVTPSVSSDSTAASVTLRTVVDEAGNVAELRLAGYALRDGDSSVVVSGGPNSVMRIESPQLEAFIQSAASAVRQSRFEAPAGGAVVFNTVVQFAFDAETIVRDMPISERVTNDGALRVGGNVRTPRKIKDARPVYPQEARDARVQGVVILEMRIDPDGRVGSARVLRSIPLLDQAALDAVQQWEFEPTLLNGAAVAVVMTVTVQFTAQ